MYNVILNPVGGLCTMQPLMTENRWAVVYNVSQKLVSLFCTMHLIIIKPGWAIVYNVSQRPVDPLCKLFVYNRSNNWKPQLGCYVQCNPEHGWWVVYYAAINDRK